MQIFVECFFKSNMYSDYRKQSCVIVNDPEFGGSFFELCCRVIKTAVKVNSLHFNQDCWSILFWWDQALQIRIKKCWSGSGSDLLKATSNFDLLIVKKLKKFNKFCHHKCIVHGVVLHGGEDEGEKIFRLCSCRVYRSKERTPWLPGIGIAFAWGFLLLWSLL